MQHFKKGDCDFLVTLQEVATLKESGIATCVLHAIDSSVEGQELPSPCDAIKTALARDRAPPSHEAEPSCAQYRNVSRRARHRRAVVGGMPEHGTQACHTETLQSMGGKVGRGLHGTFRTIAYDRPIRTHKRDARNDTCGVHMPTPRDNSTRWEFYHDEVSPRHAWMSTKSPPCGQLRHREHNRG